MNTTSGNNEFDGEDATFYVYVCGACMEDEEKTLSQHQKRKKEQKYKCSHCGEKEMSFSFKLNKTSSFNRNRVPRTVGALAEQNFEKNKDKILEQKHNEKVARYNRIRDKAAKNGVEIPKDMPDPKPYGEKSYTEINKMTDEQKNRYLAEGE